MSERLRDPCEVPQARRVYRCLVCGAIFDYDVCPPERVVLFNADRDESGLPCLCPGCADLMLDQARRMLDGQAGKGKAQDTPT